MTIEVLPDLKTKAALDPNVFAFFKGLNAVANQDGVLSADVEKGLPVGDYRLCSVSQLSLLINIAWLFFLTLKVD